MEEELRRRFGQLVAAHRRRCGFTQDELASRAEISVEMISRLEAGTSGARFATVARLAHALDVDPAELFTPHLPSSALERPKLTSMMARLSKLSDGDLDWLDNVLTAILRHR